MDVIMNKNYRAKIYIFLVALEKFLRFVLHTINPKSQKTNMILLRKNVLFY